MTYVIDRRLNGKNKSTVNRQRFLKRYRQHIKKAVDEAINERSIQDIENGEKISIPSKDINEPIFHHGPGGKNDIILPGNKDFVVGDQIKRPQQGAGGGGGGQASDQGEGEDDFVFQISRDEFLNFMFDDLELPNLTKRQLAGTESFKTVRAGISNEGNPNQINIIRSLRSANARRIALTGKKRKQLKEYEQELANLQKNNSDYDRQLQLKEAIVELKNRIRKVPFIDTFDLKYNLHTKQPVPSSRAVMFCLMDVSGSMTQATKDIAKRFFILLYLFLQRNYEKTEVVFIRHHTAAKEVEEQEFFYSRETGGTIVSSALKLMQKIIEARYPADEWNIYGAQASDGDNWNDDSDVCHKLLDEQLLPLCQYFSYLEITSRDHQALWQEYEAVQQKYPQKFSMRQIEHASEIYPIFRDLFQRRESHAA